MRYRQLILIVLLPAFCTGNVLYGQLGVVDSGINKVSQYLLNLKPAALKAMDKQYARTEMRLARQSNTYLRKLERREEKLKNRLAKTDSVKAAQVFGNIRQRYAQLRNKLPKNEGRVSGIGQYIPGLDSMLTASKYLSEVASGLPGYSPEKMQLLQQLGGSLSSIQQQMKSASDIKEVLRQREAELKQQLKNSVVAKQLDGINKDIYYYQQQINEYRSLLNDPAKLQQVTLGLLRETPAFKEFMRNNSQLSQLFSMPSGYGTAAALQGLQTRTGIQQQLSQRLSGTGTNAQQYLQQQVQAAQSELNKLKDKVNQLGGSGSDMVMPEFKPNTQKTKSFWKRLEYGLNIQSQKTNALLPTTSDIALIVGYKLNDKSTLGAGAGYKLGWGNNISNIHLTSQGVSLRTYLDVKLKGSIWISGGLEENYQQEFTKIDELKNINAWQRSGLIGLTKKYNIGKKKGNLQLLWDFLSYSQVPRTTAIKFRLGYTL